ncbi:MAG: HEAT repeat domain-containing protein [Phycisphaerae bacterium]|nr:HEAT repeat domain-containing protein [Phycisphaerae bacterium]
MWKTVAISVLVLVATALTAAGQDAATQPTTQAAVDQERLKSLLALIEDPQNPAETRRTGVRELFVQGWAETPARLASILSDRNGPAKAAVAEVLTELPQYLDAAYVDPLVEMLADADADVRTAAAETLAAYRNGGVIPRLRELALATQQPQQARLGAIAALGFMTQREAINGLAEALADPEGEIAGAALEALQQATAMDFLDVAAARKWWEVSRNLTDEQWQRLQIERLVKKARQTRGRLEAVEARLLGILEANFRRASELERGMLLTTYMADSSTTIRLLGLRLTHSHLAEGRDLPAGLSVRVREFLSSAEPQEQAAAVRTVASFRKAEDAETFIAMLSAAQSRAVRLALINGLGYVGDGPATQALLDVLEGALGKSDEECATEAVAALGRLAERGALHNEKRGEVVAVLLRVFEKTKPAQVALRERVLWAMGNMADVGFGPAFAAALDEAEAVAVRQAAARGIAVLNDPKLADALAAAASDADAGVRKTAIETLAVLGSSDQHLQALWNRLSSPPESDEAIRQAAWRGVLALLSQRDPAQIEEWLARLPGDDPQQKQRALDLLQRIARVVQESEPVDRGRLGAIRARIAAQHVLLEQPAEAVAEYLRALADLHDGDSEQRVALELLRLSLRSGRYDQAVAQALGSRNPEPDYKAYWQTIKSEVEPRLTPEGVDQALALLKAVTDNPPGKWPAEVERSLAELRARATQLKGPPPQPAAPVEPQVAPPTESKTVPPTESVIAPSVEPPSQPQVEPNVVPPRPESQPAERPEELDGLGQVKPVDSLVGK